MAVTQLTGGVWTEREADDPATPGINEGDWESCVVKSYAMGLLHGGVRMAAPYTQAEANKLEVVKDSPQDLGTTDPMSVKAYGVKLRMLSVGTVLAAVSRPGTGVCLTGVGCPGRKWQLGTFTHEVFYVAVTTTVGDLYDPMAPNGTPPERVAASTMAAWALGAGPNQAREVRANEFATGVNMPVIEALQGLPNGAAVQLKAGRQYQFFAFDPATGARTSWAYTPPSNSSAGTEGLVDLTGEGPAYFLPRVYSLQGMRTNAYLPEGSVGPGELYIPVVQPEDCTAKVAAAVLARDAEWEAKQEASLHP